MSFRPLVTVTALALSAPLAGVNVIVAVSLDTSSVPSTAFPLASTIIIVSPSFALAGANTMLAPLAFVPVKTTLLPLKLADTVSALVSVTVSTTGALNQFAFTLAGTVASSVRI